MIIQMIYVCIVILKLQDLIKLDFVFDVAYGELQHYAREANKHKFVSYNLLEEKNSTNQIPDKFNGF